MPTPLGGKPRCQECGEEGHNRARHVGATRKPWVHRDPVGVEMGPPACKACLRAGARAKDCWDCVKRERQRERCPVCQRLKCPGRSAHPTPLRPLKCTECGEVGHNRRRHGVVPIFDVTKGPRRGMSGRNEWERMRGEKAFAEGNCKNCWKRPLLAGVVICAYCKQREDWRLEAARAKAKKERPLRTRRIPPLTPFAASVLESLRQHGGWARPRDVGGAGGKRHYVALQQIAARDLADVMVSNPGAELFRFLYRARPPKVTAQDVQ